MKLKETNCKSEQERKSSGHGVVKESSQEGDEDKYKAQKGPINGRNC